LSLSEPLGEYVTVLRSFLFNLFWMATYQYLYCI